MVICETCSKEFYRKPSDVKRKKHLFCSRKCYLKWIKKKENVWNFNSVLISCHTCKKAFYRNPSKIRKHIFCSNKCRAIWQKNLFKGKRSPLWKERITKICIQCNKKFKVLPYRKHLKFCSKSCQLEFQGYKIKPTAYKMSAPLAYVIGVILSDGNIDLKRKLIRLECKDKDFAEFYAKQFEEWSGITIEAKKQKPRVRYRNGEMKKQNPMYMCKIKSVKLVNILERYTNNFRWVHNINISRKIMLLKGLWDGEGSIYKNSGCWRISFCNTDYKIITLYKNLVRDIFGIETKSYRSKRKNNEKDIYKINIYNEKNLCKFLEIIGVTIKRKLNKVKNENFLMQISQ